MRVARRNSDEEIRRRARAAASGDVEAWNVAAAAALRAGQYPPPPPWIRNPGRFMSEDEIRTVFEEALRTRSRVEATWKPGHFFQYGYFRDWPPENVPLGREYWSMSRFFVGRSTGSKPVLLHLANRTSTGGGVLDPASFVHARLLRNKWGRWSNNPPKATYVVTLHGVWSPAERRSRQFKSWATVAKLLGLPKAPRPDFPLYKSVAGGHIVVEEIRDEVEENPAADDGRYYFVHSCPGAESGKDIQLLRESERQISRKTFARKLGPGQWEWIQRELGYDRYLPISSADWQIGYYKGVYRGVPAVFLDWSAMEFIFTLGGKLGPSVSRNADERLRDLERRAAAGDQEAAAQLRRMQWRSGAGPAAVFNGLNHGDWVGIRLAIKTKYGESRRFHRRWVAHAPEKPGELFFDFPRLKQVISLAKVEVGPEGSGAPQGYLELHKNGQVYWAMGIRGSRATRVAELRPEDPPAVTNPGPDERLRRAEREGSDRAKLEAWRAGFTVPPDRIYTPTAPPNRWGEWRLGDMIVRVLPVTVMMWSGATDAPDLGLRWTFRIYVTKQTRPPEFDHYPEWGYPLRAGSGSPIHLRVGARHPTDPFHSDPPGPRPDFNDPELQQEIFSLLTGGSLRSIP